MWRLKWSKIMRWQWFFLYFSSTFSILYSFHCFLSVSWFIFVGASILYILHILFSHCFCSVCHMIHFTLALKSTEEKSNHKENKKGRERESEIEEWDQLSTSMSHHYLLSFGCDNIQLKIPIERKLDANENHFTISICFVAICVFSFSVCSLFYISLSLSQAEKT